MLFFSNQNVNNKISVLRDNFKDMFSSDIFTNDKAYDFGFYEKRQMSNVLCETPRRLDPGL